MEEGSISRAFEEPDVTFFLGLGSALAAIFGGRIGISHSEGKLASLFADCVSAGVRSCGGDAVMTDARFSALSSWSVKPLRLGLALHVEQIGSVVQTTVFDRDGIPVDRLLARRIESLMSKGEINRATSLMVGNLSGITGLGELYAQGLARDLTGLSLSVAGEHPSAMALRDALLSSGARLTERGGRGLCLEPSADGFSLTLTDERGREFGPGHVTCLVALCLFTAGKRQIGLPYSAPAALDALAARYEARVLRIGRDHEDQALYASEPCLRDAASAALTILSGISKKGLEIAEAIDSMPSFATRLREVECEGEGGDIIRRLSDSLCGFNKELCQGLRVCLDGSWVHVSPASAGRVLRIRAEATDMEAAEEICLNFVERVKRERRSHRPKGAE